MRSRSAAGRALSVKLIPAARFTAGSDPFSSAVADVWRLRGRADPRHLLQPGRRPRLSRVAGLADFDVRQAGNWNLLVDYWKSPPENVSNDGARVGTNTLNFIPCIRDHEEYGRRATRRKRNRERAGAVGVYLVSARFV